MINDESILTHSEEMQDSIEPIIHTEDIKEVILIGSDHRGFDLKAVLREHLIKLNYEVMDVGTHNKERCDYPNVAKSLIGNIMSDEDTVSSKGILICGSGFGMSITANRLKGIHAVVPRSVEECRTAREHGDVNVLCIGADFTSDVESVKIVDTFLNTDSLAVDESSRYYERIKMIDDNE